MELNIQTFKIAFKDGEPFTFDSKDLDKYNDIDSWDYDLGVDLDSPRGVILDPVTNEPRNRTDEEYAVIEAEAQAEKYRVDRVNSALIWDHIRNRQGDEKWLMDQDGLDKIKTLYKQARVIHQGLRMEREFHDVDDKLVWKLRHEYIMDQIDQVDKIVNHIEFFNAEGEIVFASHDNYEDHKVSLSSASRSDLNQSARETSVAVLVQRAEARKSQALLDIKNGADPEDPDIKLAIGFGTVVDIVYQLISSKLPLYYLRGQKIIHGVIDEAMADANHPATPYLNSPTGYFTDVGDPVPVGDYIKQQFYPR